MENGTLKLTRNSMVQGLKHSTIFAIVLTVLNFFALAYRTHKRSRQSANCSMSSYIKDDADIFDRISDHVVHIQNTTNIKCMFLIRGDFNARTATYADYVEDGSSEHVHVLPDDYQTDTPLHRMSEDKGFNHFGTNLLDFVSLLGLEF